jgi:hypothetical protein
VAMLWLEFIDNAKLLRSLWLYNSTEFVCLERPKGII